MSRKNLYTDICSNVFHFSQKTWNSPNALEWVKVKLHSHTMECYSDRKSKKLLIHGIKYATRKPERWHILWFNLYIEMGNRCQWWRRCGSHKRATWLRKGNMNIVLVEMFCVTVSILVVTLYSSLARCYLWGTWVKSTWALSVYFLIIACKSRVISKFKF